MRLTTTLTDLTPEEWALAQSILRPGYEINPDTIRVCLTVVHGTEERHVELPLGTFVEVLTCLGLERTFRKFHAALQTAKATLTPDALPDEEADRCKCGFRAPELGPHPDCPVHRPAKTPAEG